MNIRKRLRAMFKPERKLFATVLPELKKLKETLRRVSSETTNPLTAIVSFFDAVSRWHDRGLRDIIAAFEEVNYGQHDEVLTKLRTLQTHFENGGRDEYGWNRTKRGEQVMDAKVFLGNINGLFTHPVSYWKQKKDEERGSWGYPGMENLNAYDVVCRQAREFVASHTRPMIAILNELEAVA